MKEKIIVKKIISLTLAFSFLVMSLTGIMLYIVPKGRVAYWANWELFGLTKTEYANIHIISMVLFLVVAIWHIYYNWKPLTSYIKNSAKKFTLLKIELLIALLLNILFVGGTLLEVQPFKTVLDINEGIKEYWEEEYGSPPYGHAEESSLESFSRRIGVDLQEAMRLLKENGYTIEKKSQTLTNIAQKNNISPQDIYKTIKPKKASNALIMETEVSFLGRRTLEELAGMQKIDLEKSLQYIKAQNIDITPQSRMRKIADEMNITPYELFEKLKTL